MYITSDNLGRVKDAFTDLLETNNILMDLDYPFFNAYDYEGEVIFSAGYSNPRKADEYSDQSAFSPIIKNGDEYRIKFLGTLDCSRAYIEK